MRAVLASLALLACIAPASAQNRGREVRDVPWYQARPAILEETLRRCHRDARLAATWDCQNAEGAASSRLGRSFSRRGDPLLEPNYDPRTNPFGYAALQEACTRRRPGSEMFWPHCHQLSRGRLGGADGR